jgi:cytochrome c2
MFARQCVKRPLVWLICASISALALVTLGCSYEATQPIPAGDPKEGKALIAQYGCGSCHRIPGISSAQGRVGPPLHKIARRAYLGGIVPNTPDYMVQWLTKTQQLAPGSAMPDTGVSQKEAEDITAYLYTLY